MNRVRSIVSREGARGAPCLIRSIVSREREAPLAAGTLWTRFPLENVLLVVYHVRTCHVYVHGTTRAGESGSACDGTKYYVFHTHTLAAFINGSFSLYLASLSLFDIGAPRPSRRRNRGQHLKRKKKNNVFVRARARVVCHTCCAALASGHWPWPMGPCASSKCVSKVQCSTGWNCDRVAQKCPRYLHRWPSARHWRFLEEHWESID